MELRIWIPLSTRNELYTKYYYYCTIFLSIIHFPIIIIRVSLLSISKNRAWSLSEQREVNENNGITDLDLFVYSKRTIYEILLLLLYNFSFNYSLSSYNNTSLSTLDFEKYSNEI